MTHRLLSTTAVSGKITLVQAVQARGQGTITAGRDVYIGVIDSPHFFSTYGYLEARSAGAKIHIGDGTYINNGFVAIAEQTSIEIGKNCLIGSRVEIYDSDFHAKNPAARVSGVSHLGSPVKILDSVFIGSNVRILKGVTIGDGAVIGHGSVVTKSIPAHCVAAGVPAKVIGSTKGSDV